MSEPTKLSEAFYAYRGECPVELEVIMRLQSVKRWHMIDTTRQQTLAEHSANVSLLVWYIASTCPVMYFGPSEVIASQALMHDLDEVFVGDIPTHTKRASAKLFGAVKDLGREVLPKCMQPDPGERSRLMIKAADLADGIRFIRLHGVGVTARHAHEGLKKQFTALMASMTESGIPDDVVKHIKHYCTIYAYEQS
jgi:hypothetical protein